MTTYYKIIECTDPCYEAGEIVARCEASSRRQALRAFGIHDGNSHLYWCVAESRLPANLHDPLLLRRRPLNPV